MSWLYAIHGKCFTFNGRIQGMNRDPKFASLEVQAKTAGFVLGDCANYETGTHSVFIGHELHPDRFLHQGETVCAPFDPTKQVPEPLVEAVRTWLQERKVENLKESSGIILNQFD